MSKEKNFLSRFYKTKDYYEIYYNSNVREVFSVQFNTKFKTYERGDSLYCVEASLKPKNFENFSYIPKKHFKSVSVHTSKGKTFFFFDLRENNLTKFILKNKLHGDLYCS